MFRLLTEKAARSMETLRLYKPLPTQLAFHKSVAPERIVVGANRSGKTAATVSELAWILTGTHPYLPYPKENGRVFVVGADQKHLGEVYFRKMFMSGAMRMIVDLDTKRPRIYDPIKDGDRKDESKPAPPLIPVRYIEGGWRGISWENKKERVPSVIRFKTGWEVRFFPGGGTPPNGVDIDVCCLDEECPEIWYSEMSARLLDRKGKFIWSATPQAGTSILLELHERAEREHELVKQGVMEKANVEQFHMTLADNPHIDDEQKRLLALKFINDPANYRVRVLGEFIAKSYRMYPDFNEFVHGWTLDEFHTKFGSREPPRDWTRYAAVDPGHTCCAVLFAAVPPPDIGNFVLLYDELYMHGCTAAMFGERMALKTRGLAFEGFIIDTHGSARTEVGGMSIFQQYAAELRSRSVRCNRTGSQFHLGASEVIAGCERVRDMLRIRDDGTPRLRFLREMVPNFISEMKRYRKKVSKNKEGTAIVEDAPNQKGDNHLCDDIRYLAGYPDLVWVPPRPAVRQESSVSRYLKKKQKRGKKQTAGYVSLGPTGGNFYGDWV